MWRVGGTEPAAPPETELERELSGEREGGRGGAEIEGEAALVHRVTRCSSREARFSCEVAGTKDRLLTMRTRGGEDPSRMAARSKERPQLRHSDSDISTQQPFGRVRTATVSCGSAVENLSMTCGSLVCMFHIVECT